MIPLYLMYLILILLCIELLSITILHYKIDKMGREITYLGEVFKAFERHFLNAKN